MFNIFVVWMLTGFWHGAEWNFIVWGLYFGVLLMIEKSFLLKWLEKYKVFGHAYILLLGIISFIIFDAANMGAAVEHIGAMFGFAGVPVITGITLYYLRSYAVVFVLAMIGATPVPKLFVEKLMEYKLGKVVFRTLEPMIMAILLLVVTAYLVDGSFNPFLYFRF